MQVVYNGHKMVVVVVVVVVVVLIHKIPPFPQIDIIGAMMIVWRVRGKIVTTDLCNIVCISCAQYNAYTCEQT